jgi:tetratricopeptide (TPR) repeat protein
MVAASSAAIAAPKASHHARKPSATKRSDAATKADAAKADTADTKIEPPPPPPPKPVDPKVKAVLDRVAQGDAAAVKELDAMAPTVIDELGTFLARTHTATVEDRRAVLTQIKAQVPDEKGHFVALERKSAKEEKADDELDWFAELGKLDKATPGLGEVLADDAALRALAATKDVKAASVMFDTAFRDETMIYRDEVGRYLRKMSPYSIPALFKESASRNFDRKRYSNYQLERLDRQEPTKALAAAAGDENLLIAILDVWRVTRNREAVHAVWSKVNADSARTRDKAREAWRGYIEGPPPPPAPKKKIQLAGGKETKDPKPLYLTSRELADNELRKWSNELLGTDYPIPEPVLDGSDEKPGYRKPKEVKINLSEVTKELWDDYDKQRTDLEAKQWAEADAKSKSGDLAAATMLLDRLLAANPDHGAKAQMANVYFAYAKELEKKGKWGDAAAAYSKANGLAPQGPNATLALAAHHYTLGKSLEAAGKDGGPEFRAAVALRPDYAPAKEAAVRASGGSRPTWMLYLAFLAILGSAGLFGFAMLRRRGMLGRRA